MHKVDIRTASGQLDQLTNEAANGEEVIIMRSDGATFKLVPAFETKPRPRFGSAKGEIWMSDDFDEPLEDFEDYMPS